MDRQGQRMPPAKGEGDGLIRPTSSDVKETSEVTSPGVEEYDRSVAQSSPVQRVREAGIQQPGIGIPTVMDTRLQVIQELTDTGSVQNRETWPPRLPATSVSSAAVQRQYMRPCEFGWSGGTANLDISNYYIKPVGFGLPGRRPPPPSQTSIFATADWSPQFPDWFHHQYYPTQPIPSSVSSPNMPGNHCPSEETFYEEIGSDDEELSLIEVDPDRVEEEEQERSMLLQDIVGFSLENFPEKGAPESINATTSADVAPPSTLNAETLDAKLISCILKGSPEVCGMEEEVGEAAQKLELDLPKIALTDVKIEMETIGEVKNNAVEEEEKSDIGAKLEIPKDDLVSVQADVACASIKIEPATVPISSGKSSPYNTQLSVMDAMKLKLIEAKFLQNENGPGPSLLYTHLVQFYTTAKTTSKMMITGTLDICSVVETRLKEDFDLKGNTVVKSVDELKASSVDSLLQFTSFIYIKDCDGEVSMEVVVNDLVWLTNAVPASKVDLLCWRSTKSRDGNYPLVSDVAYFADMTRVITTPVYHDKPKLVKTILDYCANRFRRQVRLDQLIGAETASLRF